MHDALASGRAFTDTLLSYRKDGTPIWSELRITPIRDAQGTLRNYVCLITDVSEQMRMQAELERLALHDQLTGLPTARCSSTASPRRILQAGMHQQHTALLLLDLDHFKEVNDTFGHAVGDTLLQRVAEILRGALRATDTVARLGGMSSRCCCRRRMLRARWRPPPPCSSVLREPLLLEHAHPGGRRPASASRSTPSTATDAATLLQHADVAMYQAKRARRTASMYQPEQDLHTPDRAALREDVRVAIERGQLRLYYQPLVQLASGAVTAVEALLRWAASGARAARRRMPSCRWWRRAGCRGR